MTHTAKHLRLRRKPIVAFHRIVAPVISRRVHVLRHLLRPDANLLCHNNALVLFLARLLAPILVVLRQDLLVACPRGGLRK